MENIHNPHNISAVMRSCDAVGIFDIDLVYNDGREFNLGKKSSAGAAKWVDYCVYDNIEEAYSKQRNLGRKIFTTSLTEKSLDMYQMDFTQPICLVFGNEKNGVSNKAVQLADENFLIPQVGMIQSLNISVAAAVTLYEAYRQRLSKGMYKTTSLQENKYNKILEEWLRK